MYSKNGITNRQKIIKNEIRNKDVLWAHNNQIELNNTLHANKYNI